MCPTGLSAGILLQPFPWDFPKRVPGGALDACPPERGGKNPKTLDAADAGDDPIGQRRGRRRHRQQRRRFRVIFLAIHTGGAAYGKLRVVALSVSSPQNYHCFRVLEYILPQQVISLCAGFSQSAIPKAEVAECVQAGCDSQSIRRQLAFIAVLAADWKLCVRTRCHVEAPITKRMKCPIRAGIVRSNAFGHGKNCRLQLDDVADAE